MWLQVTHMNHETKLATTISGNHITHSHGPLVDRLKIAGAGKTWSSKREHLHRHSVKNRSHHITSCACERRRRRLGRLQSMEIVSLQDSPNSPLSQSVCVV